MTHKSKFFPGGCHPDKPDKRDLKYTKSAAFARESFGIPLPASVDLRTSPNMPPVEDQGQLGSCTAFGTLACFHFVANGQGAGFEPSHLFQYFNTRKLEGTTTTDSGASVRDAVKALAQFGAIPEAEMPYNIAHFRTKPTAKMYADAIKHQALVYLRVSNRTPDAIKTSLAAGFPVVFGATLYDSFERPDAQGNIPMPDFNRDQILGGHCQAIVGYDDARQAFLVRNSWGTSWAVGGYEWMPYAYITTGNLCSDFWTLRKVEA